MIIFFKSKIQITEIMNKTYLHNKTTYASYSIVYPFSMLSLYIRLNLFNDVHFFSSLLHLFHNVIPVTVIQ